jgi:nucleoside-diphosphate kinase
VIGRPSQPQLTTLTATSTIVTLLDKFTRRGGQSANSSPAVADNLQPKSAMERTLILLKPDCVQRRLIGAIIQRFEQKGLRLAGLKLVQASRALAEKHYAVHKGKPFYDSLLQFITSGPTVAMVWEGREAVAVARTLMGPTDGTKAAPATIRGDFALSVQNNLIHGSDSPENAEMEIALWFKPEELVDYKPTDAAWIG